MRSYQNPGKNGMNRNGLDSALENDDYNHCKISGWRKYSAEEVIVTLEVYRDLILHQMYEDAREIEERGGFPQNWLDRVISGIIDNSDENSVKGGLLRAFHDRNLG